MGSSPGAATFFWNDLTKDAVSRVIRFSPLTHVRKLSVTCRENVFSTGFVNNIDAVLFHIRYYFFNIGSKSCCLLKKQR